MIGSKLGSYEVEEEIGRGGMGVVYRARQPSLQREVAVKVLLPHLAQDADFVERFLREARAAAKLHHPGLVTIFDVGELDGTYFFSMQWLQGKTLEEKLEEPGDLPVAEVVGVVSQMAAALGYAHEAGVVHRDVKPANVIVDDLGRAVLTDFGIAQAGNETRLTRVGASVGSPDYMSPEQIKGETIDSRADLYSLGVLFHHLLTGEPPYTGDAPIAVAYQHLNAEVPSVLDKRPEVPPELDEIVRKLMAKAPDDRFQSAEELLAALQEVPDLEVPTPPTGIGTVPISVGPGRVAEPIVIPEPVPAARPRGGSPLGRVALAVVAAAVVGTGIYWFAVRGPAVARDANGVAPAPSEVPADPAVEPPPPVAQGFSAAIEIEPDLPDLEIWLDGQDQGLTTPAVLPVEGELGESRVLEVRRDGEVLASLDLTLGPEMDSRWAPALAPVEELFTVSSEPAGAQVALDGSTLEGVTPLEVALVPGRRLTVSLEGHVTAGWTFDPDGLSEGQRESRVLHFPLEATAPPAELVVLADYPVTVEVAGRRQTGEGEIRLQVPPGRHTVRLSARQVFYEDSLEVVLESEQSRTLETPRTVVIPVSAEGQCRLSIDGREVGDLPAPVELTVGTHTFRFEWEGGLSKEQRLNIGVSTQRIYEEMPE